MSASPIGNSKKTPVSIPKPFLPLKDKVQLCANPRFDVIQDLAMDHTIALLSVLEHYSFTNLTSCFRALSENLKSRSLDSTCKKIVDIFNTTILGGENNTIKGIEVYTSFGKEPLLNLVERWKYSLDAKIEFKTINADVFTNTLPPPINSRLFIFILNKQKKLIEELNDTRLKNLVTEDRKLQDAIDNLNKLEEYVNNLQVLNRSMSKERGDVKKLTDKISESLVVAIPENDAAVLLNSYFHFTKPLLDENSETLLSIYKIRIMSALLNALSSKDAVKQFVNTNRDMILREFYSGSQSSKDFQCERTLGETHNQGEVTYRVYLEAGEKKIYYKPRGGITEKKAIDLFKKLNDLRPDLSELQCSLPFYKIISISEKASLWEGVMGSHGEHGQLASFNIKHSTEQEIFKKNLVRLNTVCAAIGIYDLHSENMIYSSSGACIPIDLECIDLFSQRPTGLIATSDSYHDWARTYPACSNLNQNEREAIQAFRDECFSSYNTRIVPFITKKLLPKIQSRFPHDPAKALMHMIAGLNEQAEKEEKIGKCCSPIVMLEFILKDFMLYDVPYFTRIKDNVYWGDSQKDDHLIYVFNKKE